MIRVAGDKATTWYNYTLASAGTITDENTTSSNPATNTTPATESICPKGWTLPSKTQIDGQRNVSSFSPVLGGLYVNGSLYNESTDGYWWDSTAYNSAIRYRLSYNGSSLYTGNGGRHDGFYVRCVAKQKTITDLAYMQDVTDAMRIDYLFFSPESKYIFT